jgi:hypothetical protein
LGIAHQQVPGSSGGIVTKTGFIKNLESGKKDIVSRYQVGSK